MCLFDSLVVGLLGSVLVSLVGSRKKDSLLPASWVGSLWPVQGGDSAAVLRCAESCEGLADHWVLLFCAVQRQSARSLSWVTKGGPTFCRDGWGSTNTPF